MKNYCTLSSGAAWAACVYTQDRATEGGNWERAKPYACRSRLAHFLSALHCEIVLENGVEFSLWCWRGFPWLLFFKLRSPSSSWNQSICPSRNWHKEEFKEVRTVGRLVNSIMCAKFSSVNLFLHTNFCLRNDLLRTYTLC